ncbi:MAG: hypothetical protein ACE5KE_06170 [Methanosarcinales archaeon]
MKAKQLIFNTDYTAEFFSKKVKNGAILTEDKEFVIDRAKPMMLKRNGFLSSIFGSKSIPFYLLKWNILVPAQFKAKVTEGKLKDLKGEIKSKIFREKIEKKIKEDREFGEKNYIFKELVPLDLKFPKPDIKEGEALITPEILQSTIDMRFLKNFKTYADGGGISRKKIMDILFVAGMIMFLFVAMAIGGVLG